MIKNFTTIYSRLKNADILKMPGMTSYYLSALSGKKIKCNIVSLNNDDYVYYESVKDSYGLILIGEGKKREHPYLPVLKYLFHNSTRIDVLNLYHLDLETLLYSFVYKLLNGKGKLLLELDADERIKEFFTTADRRGILKITNKVRPLKSIILNGLISLSDFIAVETETIYNYLVERGNKKLNRKLFLNPYGINADELKNNFTEGIKKENILITVGRIGSYQKNNEMLMNAVAKMNNRGDWKFYFIGPIEREFDKNIKTFFEKYPELKDAVVFTGEIRDRKLLAEYMQRAKVFCLTSRYESWGIVLNEAAYNGCYIVSTDTGCAGEVIKEIADGEIIKDSDSLISLLDRIIQGNLNFDNVLKNGAKEYVENKSWEKTTGLLMKRIFPEL